MESASPHTPPSMSSMNTAPDNLPVRTERRLPRVLASTVALISLLICALGVQRVSREEERASDTLAIPALGVATFHVCRRSSGECLGSVHVESPGESSLEITLEGTLSGQKDGDTEVRGRFAFSGYRLLEFASIDIRSARASLRVLSNPKDLTRADVTFSGDKKQGFSVQIPQPVLFLGDHTASRYIVFPAFLTEDFGDLDFYPASTKAGEKRKFMRAKTDLPTAGFEQLDYFHQEARD
ncbi:MAG: hypothetical protein IT290_12425 [Deltaproteobacteria bacterium]|nr:hypothetical protein [Deltaproteobacteria bacterium]